MCSFLATCCIVASKDLHWSLHSGRDPKDINLITLRMLLLADRANPCKLDLLRLLLLYFLAAVYIQAKMLIFPQPPFL